MNEIKFIGRDDMTPPKGWTEQEPNNNNLDDYQEVIKQWTAPMDGHDPNHDDIVSIEKMDDGRFEVVTYIAFGDDTEEEELTFDNFNAAMVKAVEIMKDISSHWDDDYEDEEDEEEEIYEDHQFLKGGKGDKLNPKDVDPTELEKGTKHEMEHTNDPKIAREIAMDHLAEDPHYYKHLDQAGLDESTIRRLQKLAGIKSTNEIKVVKSSDTLIYFAKAYIKEILNAIHEQDREKTGLEGIELEDMEFASQDVEDGEGNYAEEIHVYPPGGEQDCKGLIISDKDNGWHMENGESGTHFNKIPGLNFKGEPLYYDTIWC